MPQLLIQRKLFFKVFLIYFSGQFQETWKRLEIAIASCVQ
jgi:hypothetical protein